MAAQRTASGGSRRPPVEPPPPRTRLTAAERTARKKRRRRRNIWVIGGLLALAAGALAAGILVGTRESSEQKLAQRFVNAWERGDYAAMYRLTTQGDRSAGRARFVAAYETAADTATLRKISAGEPSEPKDGKVTVPITARTRLWGPIRGEIVLSVKGSGESARVNWSPELVFPGLKQGETLGRRTQMPARADIVSRNGTTIAAGVDRTGDLASAGNIVGELGTPPPAERTKLFARGYPDDALVGVSGLERVFETEVAGRPGGTLLAGRRVLDRARPKKGKAVKSTIDDKIQNAAVASLGGQLGGVAALDPDTGEILGLAGLAFSTLQPPGSTMKMITVTEALEKKIVNFGSEFPVVTSGVAGGQVIQNAGGEACGGDLREVFAESCNSVFAPLGVKIGGKDFVAAAERFGFNEPTGIPGAVENTIPPAEEMTGDNEVGSSAIGQGRVQSTPLGMAGVAQAIANRGVRLRPVLVKGEKAKKVRATPPRIADKVTDLMLGVVNFGTGTSAAIPGGRVAGKTGTAELGGDLKDDAWFAAFAPARKPKIVVGVLVVQAGFGGDVAAPIAKGVIEAAL
jgi:penicillin-binding protein A